MIYVLVYKMIKVLYNNFQTFDKNVYFGMDQSPGCRCTNVEVHTKVW